MEEKIIFFKNSKEWIDFVNYYDGPNVCKQIGLFRYEDTNTNFFASLFNEKDYYGYGTYPVKLLLELIKCKSNGEYFKNLDFCEIDVLNVKPYLHKSFGKGCIPDFVLEFDIKFSDNKIIKYAILLEAKFVSSCESKNQCERYYESFENYKDYEDREKIYLFLSLESDPKLSYEEINVNDIYLKISYQDLIDYVYDPCILNSKKDIAFSVREYVKCFSEIYDWSISNDMIPLSNEGKSLTLDVWNKHKDFFEFMFNNASNSFISNFYKSNSNIFRILFINLNKLSCIRNVNVSYIALNVKKPNGLMNSETKKCEYYSNKDFVINLVKDINKYYPDKMNFINKCFENYPLFISDEEYNSLTKGCGLSYYYENKLNASMLGLEGTLVYHIICLNNDEISKLIDFVIKNISDYDGRIFRISDDIKYLIKNKNAS